MTSSTARNQTISIALNQREKAKLKRYAIAAGASVPEIIRDYISRMPNYWYIHLEDEQPNH